MKKSLLLFLLLAGCSSMKEYPAATEYFALDFTAHSDFLITPESYEGQYASIGLLTVASWPRAQKMKDPATAGVYIPPEASRQAVLDGTWIIFPIDRAAMVSALVEQARAMGADAIIRFQTQWRVRDLPGGLTILGIEASGFAIKRQ